MKPGSGLPAVLRRLLVAVVSAVVTLSAWAAVDAPAAESLLRKSGLWLQLAHVAPQVRNGTVAALARARTRPSQAEMERLFRAIDAAYSARSLRAACVAALSRELVPDHVAALGRWYDGPSGKAMTRLEQAQSGRNSQAILDEGAALLRDMPSSRRRILDEVVLATRSAELMTEITIGATLAVHQGAASANAARLPPGELKAALDARRHQFMRNFTALSLAGFAATYSSVPDAELEKYVDFLKSEAGRHYIAVSGRALSAALFNAATDFGRTAPGYRDRANT
jgi:hypothetical protein